MTVGIFGLTGIAFAMATDAFAAALVQGTHRHKIGLKMTVQVGLVFGVIEALTPLLGYFLGKMTESWVQAFDHWLSFVLLVGLGGHLLYETLTNTTQIAQPVAMGYRTFLTAIATSIDAFVVGVSLAFLQVNIWLMCCLIGMATFLMTTLGVSLGRKLGQRIGKHAQIIGAIVLIAMGVYILVSHLSDLGQITVRTNT